MKRVKAGEHTYTVRCADSGDKIEISLWNGQNDISFRFPKSEVPALKEMGYPAIERRLVQTVSEYKDFTEGIFKDVEESKKSKNAAHLVRAARSGFYDLLSRALQDDHDYSNAEKDFRKAQRSERLARYGGLFAGAVILGVVAVGNPSPAQYLFNITGIGAMAGLAVNASDKKEKLEEAKEMLQDAREIVMKNTRIKKQLEGSYSKNKERFLKEIMERSGMVKPIPQEREIIYEPTRSQQRVMGV